MAYPVEKIEGVGALYAGKLAAVVVKTTEDLLKACGPAKGRKDLAAKTGIAEALVLKWINMADLMRIKGVGEEFSGLLEKSGVDTVKELATRRAGNLAKKMAEVNAAKRLARRMPTEADAKGWIEQAKTLPPAVSH